jgi:GntR family transcriptional regulator
MKLIPGSSRTPLYHQLVDALKAKIQDDSLKSGDKLPSEHELMKEFGISRITVRKAVSELIADGLVYSLHGKGTFISKKRIQHTLGRMLGFIEELELDGIRTEVDVVKSGFEAPTHHLIEVLGIEPTDQIFMLERLISANGEPLFIEYAWFPKTFSRFIATADLRKAVLYHVFELAGLRLMHALQEIRAGRAAAAESNLLKVKKYSPVLLIDRITFAGADLPISFSKAVYRADRYSYKVDLSR